VVEAVLQVPGEIQVIVIPPVDEVGGRVGEFEHPLLYVAERTGGRRLVHDPDFWMIDAERNRVLVVDQQRRVPKLRLLQKASKSLAREGVPCVGSHQAVDLHDIGLRYARLTADRTTPNVW